MLASLASGCAGLFQHALPERVASFAVRATGAMRVGFAAIDVTPSDPAPYLGGFDLNRRASAVHSRLEARAMVVQVGELRVAVVGIDNLGLQLHDTDWIKAGVPGFANGCVFLCSSHTHAGPDPIGLWGKYMLTTGRDGAYIADLRRAVAEVVATAAAAARPARFLRGAARLPPLGVVRNTNRAGVFDRTVEVLHAVALDDGAALGSVLHLACHPEVLRRGNTEISADFVGALCRRWADAGHGQAVFVNGALGAMITPKQIGVDAVEPTAQVLFEVAERALADAAPLVGDELEVRRRDVYLPMQSWALRLSRLTTVVPREVYAGSVRTTVGYLRIGDFEACCVPGEGEPGWAQRVVAGSGRSRLAVWGLVDDEVGYLMSEADARHPDFEYERTMSPGVRAGEMVLRALVEPQLTSSGSGSG